MRRAIVVLAVVATACSGSTGEPSTTSVTPSTTTSTVAATSTTTVAVASTTTIAPVDRIALAEAFAEALESADRAAITMLLAPNAAWVLAEEPIGLDLPLPAGFAEFAGALGLESDASFLDVVVELRVQRVDLGAEISLTDCADTAIGVACAYREGDVLSPLTGQAELGTIELALDAAGLITEVWLDTAASTTDPDPERDAFFRWSAIEQPDITNRSTASGPVAELVTGLLERWEAAGRPDLPAPDPAADPTDVVAAYLTARNDRDWEAHMALLGGEALDNPFGSRDEFDAAAFLERRITPLECEITLESARQGTFVACQVEVTDIIVEAAGATPTNPNATTFRVMEGRVIDLPEFLPSLFIAEDAIERWAEANEPAAYAAACPFGIAGQSVLDGRACAEFIAFHREAWAPLVATG